VAYNDAIRLVLATLSEGGDSTRLLCGTVKVTVTLHVPGGVESLVVGAGMEAPKSCRYSSKLNACSALVPANPDDDSRSSLSCRWGGASMLTTANSSSVVGLVMNVAGSSPRLHSVSSNAEELHIPGG
jgi:hypothetical protein